MAYYLRDGDIPLTCKTEGMKDHLIKHGAWEISEAEFLLLERVYYQRICYRRDATDQLRRLSRSV